MIVIIDYSMGNPGSILNMLKKIGAQGVISGDPEEITRADKLILPGVGAFDEGMKNLNKAGIRDALEKKVLGENAPILGICLGIQLFTKRSEEGKDSGLGWIDAETIRFRFDPMTTQLKIPHMGWNTVKLLKDSYLFQDMYDNPRFYFVHSYHLVCANPEDVLTTTHHAYEFVSGIQRGNITGLQFHPEKSHKFGIRLLTNFARS